MRIAVIDGQGGGIGKHITAKIRDVLPREVGVLALGTNAVATSLMLKAGANEGATGENAVVQNVTKVDIITGSISIIIPNSMLGELTPGMANAIASSSAKKILLPLNPGEVEIVGIKKEPLPHQIDDMVLLLKKMLEVELNV